jgi:hypothetical protein
LLHQAASAACSAAALLCAAHASSVPVAQLAAALRRSALGGGTPASAAADAKALAFPTAPLWGGPAQLRQTLRAVALLASEELPELTALFALAQCPLPLVSHLWCCLLEFVRDQFLIRDAGVRAVAARELCGLPAARPDRRVRRRQRPVRAAIHGQRTRFRSKPC